MLIKFRLKQIRDDSRKEELPDLTWGRHFERKQTQNGKPGSQDSVFWVTVDTGIVNLYCLQVWKHKVK